MCSFIASSLRSFFAHTFAVASIAALPLPPLDTGAIPVVLCVQESHTACYEGFVGGQLKFDTYGTRTAPCRPPAHSGWTCAAFMVKLCT